MEMTIAPSISLLKSGFHGVRCFEEIFFPDLEENFSPGRVEGSVRGLGMVGSVLPILLLEGPMGGPQEGSARGLFWSLRFCYLCLQHWKPKVLRDRLISYLWCEGRCANGTLSEFFL
ncbi:hypothetical protein B296_00048017 [Ensete ventricosum]|uniref:Uncharacterized protein n=1 Tax=Ensete ventricosum TaxID=4639 RepID=A0A426YWU6_ENSVE|nr:hypothetical protein B296_00048017 [Ensete ventricosum]